MSSLSYSYYAMIESQRNAFKYLREVFNEKVLAQAHRYPKDPLVFYKFQFNCVIRMGALFDYESKNNNFAKIGILLAVLLHEMQHFQGREFEHATNALGYATDLVTNGPFSISIPIFERLLKACNNHARARSAGVVFPFK
jgi:hypothetical protein